MPAAVAVPIAGAVLGAIGSGIAGVQQSRAAKAAMKAQLNYDGSPTQVGLRGDMSGLFRSQLGDIFSGDYNNMLRSRYREMLDPGYNQTLSTDVENMLNHYRDAMRPAFNQGLQDSMNTAKTNLGGQYGIRYGSDAVRILGDTAGRANVNFERDISALYPQLFSQVGALNLSTLQGARNDQMAALAPILQFAMNNPQIGNLSSYPTANLGVSNFLSSIGGTMAQYPLMAKLYGSGTTTTPTS